MLAGARCARPLLVGVALLTILTACTGSDAPADQVTGTSAVSGRAGAWLSDPATVRAVLAAARRGLAATSTYDYRRLDRFREAIRTATTQPLTGQLLATVDGAIASAGTRLHVVQVATIDEAGIGPITSEGVATVLSFGQVEVHSTKYPHGHRQSFDVVAKLQQDGGHWLLSGLSGDGDIVGAPPGTPALADAADAARQGLRSLVSFHRRGFAADFARALAATTGALRRQLAADRAKTLRAVEQGDFDLVGVVRALAVESARGDTVTVLAQLDGYQVTNGRRGMATKRSLKATLVRSGGRWLLSAVQSAG